MIRQDPTPVMIRITAPTKQASADVSPMEPGINPMKASHQVTPAATAAWPPSAATASQVAPL